MSKKHKHISAVKTTEQKAVQQSQQPQELTPQKLNRLLEKNPFAQLLGMELLEVREGYAYGRMRMDEHFTNIYGGMHGGCSYALADTLAGVAASTYGNYVTTIDGKMNYLEAKSNVKIKASENGEIAFCLVWLSARNRVLFSSERRLPFRMMFRRFTQRHIKRQKRKVPPVTNVSLAVFPAESRASKTSALWRTGVTI